MNGRKTYLLRLLLIAIMALQPVVSVYAMAAMDHSPAGMMSGHGGMEHAVMQHDGMDDDGVASPAVTGDCCASEAACAMAACPMSACAAALLTNSLTVARIEIPLPVSVYLPSWAGISAPTETKPPRTSLG